MRHDFDVKTNHSYGESSPDEVAAELLRQGVNVASFTDLFSLGTELVAPVTGIKMYFSKNRVSNHSLPFA